MRHLIQVLNLGVLLRGFVIKFLKKVFVALGGAAVFASITGFFQGSGGSVLGLLIALYLLGGCTADFRLVITGEGFGTVTFSHTDTTCTITNSGTSDDCEVVVSGLTTLTATPSSGYVFVQWQNCPAATGNTCEVKDENSGLDNEITIKVIFDD